MNYAEGVGREAVHRVAVPDAASHVAAMEGAGWALSQRKEDGETIVFRWRYDPEAASRHEGSQSTVDQRRLDEAKGMAAPEAVLQFERRIGKKASGRHFIDANSTIWDHRPSVVDSSDGSWISRGVDFVWDDGRIEESAVGTTHIRAVDASQIPPHRTITIGESPIAGHYSGSITEHHASGTVSTGIRDGEPVAAAFRRLAGDPPQWIITREQTGEEAPDGSWKHTEVGAVYRVFEGPPASTVGENRDLRRRREQRLFNGPLMRASVGALGCLFSVGYVLLCLLGIGLLIALLAGADVLVVFLAVVAAFFGLRLADARLQRSRAWTGAG